MITRWLENMGVCAACAALYLLAGPLWNELQQACRNISHVFDWMAQ